MPPFPSASLRVPTRHKISSINCFSFFMLYVACKRGLPRKFSRFVLFRPIKKRSFNLLCVLDLFQNITIYPLTARVVGALQMISQPVSSISPCSPLPSGTWRTLGLSIPWCCIPTSSSVCLVFFPLSLCLARWLWPDLMNGRHDHATAVCVCIRWSGRLRVVTLPAGSWHGLPSL